MTIKEWGLIILGIIVLVSVVVYILWGIELHRLNKTLGKPRTEPRETLQFPTEIIERTISLKHKGWGQASEFYSHEFKILSEERKMTYEPVIENDMHHEVSALFYGYQYKMVTIIRGSKIIATRYFLIGNESEEKDKKELRNLKQFTHFILGLTKKMPELDKEIERYNKEKKHE